MWGFSVFVVCGVYSQNQESWADNPEARPGGLHPEVCILMKRNSGAEMTVLNLWHFFG